jgi:hypothetical protein
LILHRSTLKKVAQCLLQVENGLRGGASKAGDAFRDEVLHALGDVGLLEEASPSPAAWIKASSCSIWSLSFINRMFGWSW